MFYPSAPVRTVAPTSDPVTLTEAKAHLRVTDTNEDTLIAALIDAAVSYLDGWSGVLGRCIVTQTWRQDLPEFYDRMRLPFPDVQSVTIAYTDDDSVAHTLASSTYHLVTRQDGAYVELADDQSWPATIDKYDAVRITMVCGFSTVPPALKMAVLMHVAAMFENRGQDAPMPFAYDALITPFRRVGV